MRSQVVHIHLHLSHLSSASHFNEAQDLSSSEAVVQDSESIANVKEIPSSRELRTCNYRRNNNKKGSGCRWYERCNKSGRCVVRHKYTGRSEFICISID